MTVFGILVWSRSIKVVVQPTTFRRTEHCPSNAALCLTMDLSEGNTIFEFLQDDGEGRRKYGELNDLVW